MAALVRTIAKLQDARPLRDRRLAVCLHVTKETSVLLRGLQALGAEVALAGANPLTTQDDIAAYLSAAGVHVYAWRGETPQEYFQCIRNILQRPPDAIMDDGADAHVTAHEQEPSTRPPLGGTEETTTGVMRLRALAAAGKLRYPIIAVNNAYTKFLFDNRYGTGQSTFDGILRATSLLVAGKTVVVCGYGWVGKGIALRARGFGAQVIVCEVDPFRALEARMDGHEVLPLAEAATRGDLFVTATGQYRVIRREHIEAMKDGAILTNAGHFDVEIDVKALEEARVAKQVVRPHVEEFTLPSRKRVYLIGRGRIANLVAAEGHPPEVMALSFANQLLSVVHVCTAKPPLPKQLLDVPRELDRQVALNALEAMNLRIDQPTDEQVKYAQSWIG
jgi:adenosylhomocysteinase